MNRIFICLSILLCSLGARAQTPATNLLVKDGQTVAFMGDSITGMGWGVPGGYVHLVVDGLAANGVKITPIPAGVGGDTSTKMLARVDKDVIAKKPDWLTLSCGVNDVWGRGVDLATFEKQMTEIVDKVQAAGIKVMILTPTPIYEASKQEFNDKLPGYVDFLKQLAKERNLPCADIHQAWLDFIAAANQPDVTGIVTVDGVHPNPDGHLVFARTILTTFGATPEQVATAEKAWEADPAGAAFPTNFAYGAVPLTSEEVAAVTKLAADKKMDLKKLEHGIGLQAALEVLTKNDMEKNPDGGSIERQWAGITRSKVDEMTGIKPDPAAATTPQEDFHVWFSGTAPMTIAQWNAFKNACVARKQPVPVVAQICLEEAVREKLASNPDLLATWSDNITNEAHDSYVAKVMAVANGSAASSKP